MPQLVKGGKYVYGWVIIRKDGSVIIPDEAYLEYGFMSGENGIIISGSKRSGGFGLTSERLLKNTIIGRALYNHPKLKNWQNLPSNQIKVKGRRFWIVKINHNKSIILPEHSLRVLGIHINDKLLIVRGSGLALGFIAKGPIYNEAKNHPEIEFFD